MAWTTQRCLAGKEDSVLTRNDGTLSIRVPQLPGDVPWMTEALLEIGKLFPSSSVNKAGEAPCLDWQSAKTFVEGQAGTFTPPIPGFQGGSSPSTVIKILPDGNFECLREGSPFL